MRLFRQILSLEPELTRVVHAQNDLIRSLKRERETQRLTYARNTRDLIEQFLFVQKEGIDVEDELQQGLSDLADEVARLEEQCA